jgi:hypothetical protein
MSGSDDTIRCMTPKEVCHRSANNILREYGLSCKGQVGEGDIGIHVIWLWPR